MNIGLNITANDNGCKYLKGIGTRYAFAVIRCKDLEQSINCLKHRKGTTPVYAYLDKNDRNSFSGKEKSLDASFAILYDFVDAFVVSSYEDLSEDIDPLLNLRLYNDNYKTIFLYIPDDTLLDDLDEIISYCKLSNVDGLVIHNPRLARYAGNKSGDILNIVMDTDTMPKSLDETKDLNIKTMMFRPGKVNWLRLLFLLFA